MMEHCSSLTIMVLNYIEIQHMVDLWDEITLRSAFGCRAPWIIPYYNNLQCTCWSLDATAMVE
jgi:hypothetical protein